MSSANIFDGIPADLPQELFDSLVQTEQLKIERIVSCGHSSPVSGWYDQTHNEWVIVLKGAASIEFDDGCIHHLQQGDYLNIAAHRKHRVLETSSDPATVWLAIHYPVVAPELFKQPEQPETER